MTIDDSGAVALLTEMLRLPGLCGQEDAVAALLLETMKRSGFEARRDEVGNVIGTAGSSHAAREMIVLGHMDTVPGVIPIEIRDGNLYGRGAVDARGPLAAATVAAARAANSDLRITVIGAVQEEGPSLGARHLTQRVPPEYLVIAEPSGWDSLVMGYKGSQRFTVGLDQPATHTAVPEPTAPERLVAFWTRLVAWCDRRHPDSPSTGTFERLVPALIAMSSDNDGLRDHASLHVGLRLPPGIALELVREGVQELLPEGNFQFSPGEIAVRAEKTTPLVAAFLRAVRAEGGQPRFKVKTGTSDMNVVGPVWRCPMLAYGPGDSRLDHTPEEHVPIDEYLRAIRVLSHVMKEL